jgi:hypothetical protein
MQMLRRCTVSRARCGLPLVLDVPCVPPPDPAVDVLLSDLHWSTLADAFPGKVHEVVKPSEAPMFKIVAPGIRTVGLLPVRTVVAKEKSAYRWVPFLIDTGAHQSFFTDTSIQALSLDTADHIEIWSDKRVTFSKSSHHFDDINILGTDFLQHCDLHVFYTRRAVELVVSPTPTLTAVWVQQRDASGKPVGPAFEVSPAKDHVDALKDAIKMKLGPKFPSLVGPDITIYAPGATTPAEPDLTLAESGAKKPFFFVLP